MQNSIHWNNFSLFSAFTDNIKINSAIINMNCFCMWYVVEINNIFYAQSTSLGNDMAYTGDNVGPAMWKVFGHMACVDNYGLRTEVIIQEFRIIWDNFCTKKYSYPGKVLFFSQKIYVVGAHSKSPHLGASNDYPHLMFPWRNKNNTV